MSLEVLQSKSQIRSARRELRSRQISGLTPSWARLAARLRFLSGPIVGDWVKSWDVLKTVDFIKQHVGVHEWVLDIGAYASEVPWILHRLGFSKIAALDCNTELRHIRYFSPIGYTVGDFLQAPFRSETFSVITAISVIEHGLDACRLLSEIHRLLRPGGLFVASFDYWKDKIDTRGVSIFGLDWTILSSEDVGVFLEKAEALGLVPEGPIDLSTLSKPITYESFQYTFAWLVLRKRTARAQVSHQNLG